MIKQLDPDEMTFGETMLFLKVSNTMLHRLVETGSIPCRRKIMSYGRNGAGSTVKHWFSRSEVVKALEDGKLADVHSTKRLRKPRQIKAASA